MKEFKLCNHCDTVIHLLQVPATVRGAFIHRLNRLKRQRQPHRCDLLVVFVFAFPNQFGHVAPFAMCNEFKNSVRSVMFIEQTLEKKTKTPEE